MRVWKIVLLGIAVAAVAIYVVTSNEGGEIEVAATPLFLTVTNTGKAPLTILDLQINDRVECGLQPHANDSSPRSTDQLPIEAKVERHREWVKNPESGLARDANKFLIMKTGEFAIWYPTCGAAVISVAVKTENGNRTFRLR